MNQILFFYAVLGAFTFAHCNLLFQCNEFDPKEPTKCGSNVGGVHNWTIHSTKTLPKVLSNVVDITNVLYLDGNNSARADYRLNGLSHYELGVSDTLCIQYATLSSDNCLNDPATGSVCDSNVTLKNTIIGLVTLSERHFIFSDQGWNVVNFQFDLSTMSFSSRKSLEIFLHGYVVVDNLKPKSPPYIAIKFIQVNNNSCTDRIGPRKSFWIAVMAIFCSITGLTFVAIAVQHMVFEHKKRTKLISKKSFYK